MAYSFAKTNISYEKVGDEIVLLNLKTGSYYNINKLGSYICLFLNEGGSLQKIIDKIANNFKKSHQDIEKDVNSFIKKMLDENIFLKSEDSLFNVEIEKPNIKYESPDFEKFDDLADQLILDNFEEQEKRWE